MVWVQYLVDGRMRLPGKRSLRNAGRRLEGTVALVEASHEAAGADTAWIMAGAAVKRRGNSWFHTIFRPCRHDAGRGEIRANVLSR
jgi:hypothetical protein